ncbi:hypothetical protein P9112_009119 [Eukaryota sp. TZLM1-RC]
MSAKKTRTKHKKPPSSPASESSTSADVISLQTQIKHNSKTISYLRQQLADRDKSIATLEQNISQLKEIHERDLLLLESEYTSQSDTKDQTIALLKTDLLKLQSKLDGYSSMEYEHLKAVQQAERLQRELEDAKLQSQATIEMLKKEVLQVKVLLAEEFRLQVNSMESSKKQEVLKLIGPVAEATIHSNIDLRKRIFEEENESKVVLEKLEKYQQAAKQKQRMVEILEEGVTARVTSAAQFKRKIQILEEQNNELINENGSLKAQLQKFQSVKNHKNEIKNSRNGQQNNILVGQLKSRIKDLEGENYRLSIELSRFLQTPAPETQHNRIDIDSVSHYWKSEAKNQKGNQKPKIKLVAEEVSPIKGRSSGNVEKKHQVLKKEKTEDKKENLLQVTGVGQI